LRRVPESTVVAAVGMLDDVLEVAADVPVVVDGIALDQDVALSTSTTPLAWM
jgi:hypothetical protein